LRPKLPRNPAPLRPRQVGGSAPGRTMAYGVPLNMASGPPAADELNTTDAPGAPGPPAPPDAPAARSSGCASCASQ
jgi:hypothetical protein